jgi:fatty acid omega-hydroxylase
VLSKNFKNFPKGDGFREIFLDIFGEGIFAADGAEWKFQRKISSHAFTQNIFKDFMYDVMMRHIKQVESIFAHHQDVCFFSVINRFTVDSIGEIGFGTDLNTLENFPEPHPFLNAFDSAQFNVMKRITEPWWPVMKKIGMGREGQLIKDMKLLNTRSLEIAQKIKKDFEEKGKGSDFLSLFLKKAKEEKTVLSDNFLADVALNFLIAGRDTTACTLSWLFFELTQHPEVLTKVREEIETVLNGEELRFEHLSKFKYMKAVQDETLRLHPVVPQDVHYADNDDTFPDGTQIKKGTAVFYLPYAQGRDVELWGEDAKEFKPERWLNVDKASRDFQFKYPVFHAGPRICLGRHMATMEMTIAMAYLLPRFNIELNMKPEDVQYQITIVLQIKDQLKMRFTPREQASQ